MSTSNNTEILLGCDPQVRVVIIEDAGNLMLEVYAQDPENTDIDALFLNLTDPSMAGDLNVYPAFNEDIGSNGENVTGVDIQTGALNQLNNGAQVQDQYDVKLEFGEIAYTSYGDVDEAKFTFWVDGAQPLTADSIDLSNMTAVINSDHGQNGLALTGGVGGGDEGGSGGGTVYETTTAISESFDSSGSGWTWWGWHDNTQAGDDVVRNDWDLRHGEVMTNGNSDGVLALAPVESDGPVTMSFDIRAEGLRNFEGGSHGDSLSVQVRLDNGDWQTLDTFIIDEHSDTFTGDQTGQTFAGHSTTLNYSGGVLDTVDGAAQFRLVSNISACDEKIFVDDIEITVSEAVDAPATGETTVVMDENFDHLWSLDHSENVVRDGGWNAEHGQAMTDGRNDGTLKFAEVATSDPVALSLDMRAEGLRNFENDNDWGCIADSLRVEAQIDGGDWVLLDEFQVNDSGTAMVGSLTGQTFDGDMTALNYSGGVLDTATDDVQVRLVSDISSWNEKIYVDNVQLVTTTGEGSETEEVCEDFEGAEAGDTAALQFDGVSVTAQRAGDDASSQNDAMIFDTANPTGRDWDLGYHDQGNALIISEDNDANDPDDNYHGGTITFDFEAVSDVSSLTLLDIEEEGGSIDLFDTDGELINSIAIPSAGNNSAQDVAINATGVAQMQVNLAGSGAVDDLCYSTSEGADADCGQYDVTYDDTMTQQMTPEEVAAMLAEQEAEEAAEELEDMVA